MEIFDIIALIVLIIYFIIALIITECCEIRMRKESDISKTDITFCIIIGITWFIAVPLLLYLKYRRYHKKNF